MLSLVPETFVGPLPRLVEITQAICREMAASFSEAAQAALPPWREPQVMLSRWMPAELLEESVSPPTEHQTTGTHDGCMMDQQQGSLQGVSSLHSTTASHCSSSDPATATTLPTPLPSVELACGPSLPPLLSEPSMSVSLAAPLGQGEEHASSPQLSPMSLRVEIKSLQKSDPTPSKQGSLVPCPAISSSEDHTYSCSSFDKLQGDLSSPPAETGMPCPSGPASLNEEPRTTSAPSHTHDPAAQLMPLHSMELACPSQPSDSSSSVLTSVVGAAQPFLTAPEATTHVFLEAPGATFQAQAPTKAGARRSVHLHAVDASMLPTSAPEASKRSEVPRGLRTWLRSLRARLCLAA